MITIYGIKNCDTVKKAVKWLTDHNIEYKFHDYKKDGVDEVKLQECIEKFGWQKVINRKGMTWRKLSSDEQDNVIDNKSALELMIQKPSIIKRPIIGSGSVQLLGFDVDEYNNNFVK